MSCNIGCQLLARPGVPGVHCLTRQSLIARRAPVSKRSKEGGSALSARTAVANSTFFPVTDDGPRF